MGHELTKNDIKKMEEEIEYRIVRISSIMQLKGLRIRMRAE